MVNLVAFVLGDNDFGPTFRPLLETTRRILENCPEISRELLIKTINLNITGHYLAFQLAPSPWHSDKDVYDIESTAEYLRSNLTILFDEEAAEDMQNKDHDGGAWYLYVKSGVIGSY